MQFALRSMQQLVYQVGAEEVIDQKRVYLVPSSKYKTSRDHACFSLTLEQHSFGRQYIVTPLVTAFASALDDLMSDQSIRTFLGGKPKNQ